jgi:hypothetical protein
MVCEGEVGVETVPWKHCKVAESVLIGVKFGIEVEELVVEPCRG